jgi:hypothetical protein
MKELFQKKEGEAKKAGETFSNPFNTGDVTLPATVATVVAGAFKVGRSLITSTRPTVNRRTKSVRLYEHSREPALNRR